MICSLGHTSQNFLSMLSHNCEKAPLDQSGAPLRRSPMAPSVYQSIICQVWFWEIGRYRWLHHKVSSSLLFQKLPIIIITSLSGRSRGLLIKILFNKPPSHPPLMSSSLPDFWIIRRNSLRRCCYWFFPFIFVWPRTSTPIRKTVPTPSRAVSGRPAHVQTTFYPQI